MVVERDGGSGRSPRGRAARVLMLAGAVAVWVAGCSSSTPDLGGIRADEIDYNWHVRPILSENCFKCHGPDPSARKAKLRLDVAEVAKAELLESKGKFAIVRPRSAAFPAALTFPSLFAQNVACHRDLSRE